MVSQCQVGSMRDPLAALRRDTGFAFSFLRTGRFAEVIQQILEVVPLGLSGAVERGTDTGERALGRGGRRVSLQHLARID